MTAKIHVFATEMTAKMQTAKVHVLATEMTATAKMQTAKVHVLPTKMTAEMQCADQKGADSENPGSLETVRLTTPID